MTAASSFVTAIEKDRLARRKADQPDRLSLGIEDRRAHCRQTGALNENLRHIAAQLGGDLRFHQIRLIRRRLRKHADGNHALAHFHFYVLELDRLPVLRLFRLHQPDIGPFIAPLKDGVNFIGIAGLAGNDDLEILHLLVGNLRADQPDRDHDQVVADDDTGADEFLLAQFVHPLILHGNQRGRNFFVKLLGGDASLLSRRDGAGE